MTVLRPMLMAVELPGFEDAGRGRRPRRPAAAAEEAGVGGGRGGGAWAGEVAAQDGVGHEDGFAGEGDALGAGDVRAAGDLVAGVLAGVSGRVLGTWEHTVSM